MSTVEGARKAVPIRVTPAPNTGNIPMRELQPAATANVLDPSVQPL